jgi:hypothetical protein
MAQLPLLLLAALTLTEASISLRLQEEERELSSRDSPNSDCEIVLFDKSDDNLKVRTMCVQDSVGQRSLILTSTADHSLPCNLGWWLDHNPQGLAKCAVVQDGDNTTKAVDANPQGVACANAPPCGASVDEITNGYVRTMLASALYAPPQPKKALSTLCVEMGCKSKMSKVTLDLMQTSNHTKLLDRIKKQRKARKQHHLSKNVMKKKAAPKHHLELPRPQGPWALRAKPTKVAVIVTNSVSVPIKVTSKFGRKRVPTFTANNVPVK